MEITTTYTSPRVSYHSKPQSSERTSREVGRKQTTSTILPRFELTTSHSPLSSPHLLHYAYNLREMQFILWSRKDNTRKIQRFCDDSSTTRRAAALASMVPIAPAVATPSMPPNATAGARQAKKRKKIVDSTCRYRRSVSPETETRRMVRQSRRKDKAAGKARGET